MKKIILTIVYSICIAVILCSFANAQILEFNFDTSESVSSKISADSVSGLTYSFDEDDKALKIVTTNNDPFFSINFPSSISASTYKYVYYRFKVTDGIDYANAGQFFIDNHIVGLGNEGTVTAFSLDKTSDWQDVCIDLTALSAWSGTVYGFRIDPVHQESFHQVTFLIDTVVFCSTEDEVTVLENECKEMNGGLKWTFDSYENFKRHIPNLSSLDYESEDGYVVLTPEGDDPMLGIMLTESERFDADSVPYVAFRMRVDSTVNLGSLLFEAGIYDLTQTRVDFRVVGNGEWNNYIINMSEAHQYWTGEVKVLRFDFLDRKSNGASYLDEILDSKIVVDRIGVFETRDDAEEFLNSEITCNVVFPFEGYINTGAPTPSWDFRADPNISRKWFSVNSTYFREHGLCGLTATSTDANLTSQFSEADYFSADEFKYFGIRIKNVSVGKRGGLYFKNDTNVSDFDQSGLSPIQYKTDGEWENIIVNNKKRFPDKWKGLITAVRLDLLNPSYNDAVVYISRAGFFRSEQDALDFLNAADDTPDYSQPAVFKDNYQRVYIPSGTLNEGYDLSKYMLSSTTPVGSGTDPLVMYINSLGEQTVVPMSDVNSAGFARFVSQKPGTYTIGYNNHAFSDTVNHWAESHINYVAQREILLGTSVNEFSPDMPLTRGMFVTALGRMHGVEQDFSNEDFDTECSDIDSSMGYAPYAVWALSNNIVELRDNNTFSPEQPITRAEMVIAISNYAFVYGFEHDFYNNTDNFTDIGSYSEAFEQALDKLQKWGVIKGINSTEFDPQGIITRAEASEIFENLIKSLTGAAMVDTEYTNEEITKKRIRLGVWGFNFNEKEEVDRLKDLGVNFICSGIGASDETVWDLCDKYGIELMMQDYSLVGTPIIENGKEKIDEKGYIYKKYTPVDLDTLTAEYIEHPSFGGHYFIDEPGSFDMGWIGDAVEAYYERFPDKTAFVNLLPMYANDAQLKYSAGAAAIEYYDPSPGVYKEYCQTWFDTSNAPFICADIYPLNWLDGIQDDAHKHTYKDYVESINQIATVARENNAEFWCCIQTHGWIDSKRTPNEAEFRWQSYSLLSFGATGILLWSYTTSNPKFPSMINVPTRTINQSYYDCQKVFNELNSISDIYIKYRNLGAFTHNASESVPYLLMGNGTEYDIENTVFSEIECDNPLLFGYFVNDSDGTNAFTVVNMTEFSSNESSVVKFKLDNSVRKVISYYRGTPTVLTAVDGYYTIDLECGDGVFVTVDYTDDPQLRLDNDISYNNI